MFSDMKTAERELAVRLPREQGLSVRRIAVAVGVSRGTASVWLRDFPLTAAQRAALDARNPPLNGQMNGARANADRSRERRRGYQAQGRQHIAAGDTAFAVACALYWGEGAPKAAAPSASRTPIREWCATSST